jgi:hypothetical protein
MLALEQEAQVLWSTGYLSRSAGLTREGTFLWVALPTRRTGHDWCASYKLSIVDRVELDVSESVFQIQHLRMMVWVKTRGWESTRRHEGQLTSGGRISADRSINHTPTQRPITSPSTQCLSRV